MNNLLLRTRMLKMACGRKRQTRILERFRGSRGDDLTPYMLELLSRRGGYCGFISEGLSGPTTITVASWFFIVRRC